MVYSAFKKNYLLLSIGLSTPYNIRKEHLRASRVGVAKFIAKYNKTGSLKRRPRSGCPSMITPEMKAIVEAKMREDDKATAYQLHALLILNQFRISLRIVFRCRSAFGWTFRGSPYCQLIQKGNKVKCLEWARSHLHDDFTNVVWTDECSV